jgi:nucleoside 2-deoxyribosyltransferase
LCGPINGCTDSECKDWRAEALKRFPQAINPMRRDYRGREAECVNEIVELDKVDIQESDALLVNYDKPSVGTSMEVFFAWTLGKTVVVVARAGSVISPWLRYHSTAIVDSFAEAYSMLEPCRVWDTDPVRQLIDRESDNLKPEDDYP